jgi:hypothetical protein
MIHSAAVRSIASGRAGSITFVMLAYLVRAGSPATAARAAERHSVAVYWEPPSAAAMGTAARSAFAEAVRGRVDRLVDATQSPAEPPPLAPQLEAAKADYLRFAFAPAIARLDGLQRLADARGGGDLDGRQLSEIFLYRGLAKLETTGAESAWDDLVHAAELDPTRVLDPARFPPRSVAAFKRATAEVAVLPRTELTIQLPAQALVRIDGEAAAPVTNVTVGPHFVAVRANGYEPWAAVVTVPSAPTRLTPPLHVYQPPQGDHLMALVGPDEPRRILLGALERATGGWRFTVHDVSLPDGKLLSEAVALGDVPTRAAILSLVRRVSPPPAEPPRRWLPWALGGAAALAVALAATFVLTRDSSSPNVAGDLGTWR